jgi:hypothetical protein
VLRDIEGGVPVEADHILGISSPRGVANRSLLRIHAKACEARRARNRAAVASAHHHHTPRAAVDRAQHNRKAAAIASLVSSLAGRAANRDREASPAEGGSSDAEPPGLSKGHPGDF